jgi:hypothetical protein
MGCGTVSGLNTMRNVLEQESRSSGSGCSSPPFHCDKDKWSTYCTKETIFSIYDALAEAQRTGRTRLS